MIGWSTEHLARVVYSVTFGNCSVLNTLGFIGRADKCLESWLQKPQWKFVIFVKWDLYLIPFKFENQNSDSIKKHWWRRSDLSDLFLLSVNMLKCHKRLYDKTTWTQQFLSFFFFFLFLLDTSDAVKMKCFYGWIICTSNTITDSNTETFFWGKRTAEHSLLRNGKSSFCLKHCIFSASTDNINHVHRDMAKTSSYNCID